ncbi:hypothetical protein [Chryseobacterium balustinum]|uniref:Uncharacterized protein n=1 Tax=Chryseobacterium balustinum TaxID=246 RepID=A0AAX2IKG7_9FLAO|nr:hypothetical protein [Chryseobacterium balustinum]AZB27952.1 hypothetical protein EB354_00980 [Chryseobacterium balustinum]SKB54494.1 hypothetical protein SAMN05421800_10384 [Chryseobacterium balustinum]SQA89831.1 Uncharacterised protein [Chryseobacterium balustinum]
MKNSIIKYSALVLISAFTMSSCASSNSGNTTNLPIDIADRPADESSKKYDEANLDKLKSIIESEIAKEKCTSASDWAFAPMGSKACGGPVSYIAYPKKLEASILRKIENYTQTMSEFNKKYGITSDCMMIAEPSGIRCQGEKAVLIY